jgi:hypothetical protein
MVPVWAGEMPEKAANYHAALVKRPESAALFERFRTAWLEERSAEDLEKELLARAESAEAGALFAALKTFSDIQHTAILQAVQNLWNQVQYDRRETNSALSATAGSAPVYPVETAGLLKFVFSVHFNSSRSSHAHPTLIPRSVPNNWHRALHRRCQVTGSLDQVRGNVTCRGS